MASRATYRRLVRATENTLYGLRVRVFSHIHSLSIADHEATRRGVLVSRVTSDVETLARFAEWGAVSWMVNSAVIVGVVVVMFVYSWQLALDHPRRVRAGALHPPGPAAPPAAGLRHRAHPGGRHAVGVLRVDRWAPR